MTRKTLGWGLALVVLVIALGAWGFRPRTEAQQASGQAGPAPKYTVVDTDASNLIVVDNVTNTVYYYTEDPGKEVGEEVGEELHLRGSVDLNDVGKPVLRPKASK
jgi:hypothetical protein